MSGLILILSAKFFSIGENFPLRLPSPQERADALLMRRRLGRSLGLPPYLRLDPEDSPE
jgi:hypothetical protein